MTASSKLKRNVTPQKRAGKQIVAGDKAHKKPLVSKSMKKKEKNSLLSGNTSSTSSSFMTKFFNASEPSNNEDTNSAISTNEDNNSTSPNFKSFLNRVFQGIFVVISLNVICVLYNEIFHPDLSKTDLDRTSSSTQGDKGFFVSAAQRGDDDDFSGHQRDEEPDQEIIDMLMYDRDQGPGYTTFEDYQLYLQAVTPYDDKRSVKPYRLFVLFTTEQEQYCQKCPEFGESFKHVARSYRENKQALEDNSVFFVVIDAMKNPRMYHLHNLAQLPSINVIHLDRNLSYKKKAPGLVNVQTGHGGYPFDTRASYHRTKELTTRLLIEWVNATVKINAKLVYTSQELIRNMALLIITFGILAKLGLVLIRLLRKHPIIMALGSLFVQYMAYSGFIHNLIHGRGSLTIYGINPQTREIEYISKNPRTQHLGEGLFMALVITFAACMFIFLTHLGTNTNEKDETAFFYADDERKKEIQSELQLDQAVKACFSLIMIALCFYSIDAVFK